jgi:hypothetical protein
MSSPRPGEVDLEPAADVRFLLGSVGETEQVCRDHGAGPVGDVGVVGE